MLITKKQIRKELYAHLNCYSDEYVESVYQWVTDAPFWEWKDRLWCTRIKWGLPIEVLEETYRLITRKHYQ